MARQKLFLMEEHTEKTKLGNSFSTYYTYFNNELSIYWKNELSKRIKVKKGDAYIIDCGGGPNVKLTKIKPPRGRAAKVLWLLGFNYHNRFKTKEEMEAAIPGLCDKYYWWGFGTIRREYEDIEFVYCNREDCGGIYYLAAWASDDITDEVITKLMYENERIAYPNRWVADFCKEHFNIEIDPTKMLFYKEDI